MNTKPGMKSAFPVCLLMLIALCSPALAIELDVTWVGPNNGLWSTPTNWAPEVGGGQGPCNAGTVEFNVTIPAGIGTVVMDVADCTIRSLNIGDASTVRLATGASLVVELDASLCGDVDSQGGIFEATSDLGTMATFSCDKAQAFVSAAGQCTIDAPTYSSTTLFTGGNSNWTLMSAVDPGSVLDLSALQSINAGFNDGDVTNNTTAHFINAGLGGTIDLSSVQTITAPALWDDRVEIDLTESESSIQLDNLQTVTTASRGRVLFDVQNGATLSLPSAGTLHHAVFAVSGGSLIEANLTPGTYSSTALFATNIFGQSGGPSNWTLMSAVDPGSVLDLSALQSINAGFNDGDVTNNTTAHFINAGLGGTIDLSGVETITAPALWDDRIEIDLTDSESSIQLDNLHTVTTASRGRVLFDVQNGATLSLPSADTLHHAVFAVSGGSLIEANLTPATYSSTALFATNIFGQSGGPSNWTLMSAVDPGSVLDLSALQSINAGFNDGDVTNNTTAHFIDAGLGGTIDLSGVETITAPALWDDRIEIDLTDSESSIQLDSLQTVTTAFQGRVYFDVQNGATLSLPSAGTLHHAVFAVSGGSLIEANLTPATYSSTALFATNIFGQSGGPSNWTLMAAVDPGSVLDLSALQSINAGFNDGDVTNNTTAHFINAGLGGTIDLSGVETITAPALWDDRIEIDLTDSESSIQLDSLQTVTTAFQGRVYFDVQNGATLSLPSAGTLHHAVFAVSGGSLIEANLTPATYSSTALFATNIFGQSGGPSNWTLMSAVDPGSLLDLSALQSINAGFNDGDVTNNTTAHFISASLGGTIDLSGVQTINAPALFDDRLEINVDGEGSLIDLSSLGTIGSAGSGPLDVNLTNGGELRTGNLRATGSVDASIDLGNPESTLTAKGSLLLGDDITLRAPAGGLVNAASRLCYAHTEESNVALGMATVHFDGPGPQRVEIGGVDVDVFCEFLADDNFGFGQMIVGQDDQPTEVHLRDDLNNGNQAGNREALYLFGLGEDLCVGQMNGLRILGGSSLVLNDLNTYVYVVDDGTHQNQWVHLNSLFPKGVECIPYDDGTICRGTLSGPGDVNGDGCVDVLDLVEVVVRWGACPDAPEPCDADCDCDNQVGVNDLIKVINGWGCID